ncbi:MAG: DUF2207 domain-containing protein, partial [bacterium]
MFKKIFAFLFLLLLALPVGAQEQIEKINSFDSQITVNQDGSMIVTETIAVTSLGEEIVHGIYRDFPTRYKDKNGNNYKVGFEIISVKRDGLPTMYDTADESNGIRIYIRDQDIVIPPGQYAFEITYRTTKQLGFFADHDELYWNVTGNGWVFPIDKATAEVSLSSGILPEQIRTEGYTGSQGSMEKDFTAKIENGKVYFSSNRKLDSYEGLSIVVGWPKGFVHEPTVAEKRADWLRDNTGFFVGLIGLVIVLLYYLFFWFKVGKDPEKGTVIAQYDSPQDLSPASIGYIKNMGMSDRLFSASIIHLAVKGFLKIEKIGAHYHLKNLSTAAKNKNLPVEQDLIMNSFFASKDELIIKPSNHQEIGDALDELKGVLVENYKNKYFKLNYKYLIGGVVLSILALIVTVVISSLNNGLPSFFGSMFFLVWLSGWNIGVFAMVFVVIRGILKIKEGSRDVGTMVQTVFLAFFSAPFIFGDIAALVAFSALTSVAVTIIIFVFLVVNFLFVFLMKAPTVEGRKLMDEIEGFKLFLSVTEKDRMNFHNPPEKTPELFEKFLPYALALNVENKWAEQFTDVFAQLQAQGNAYNPNWYAGAGFSAVAVGSFASSLGSSFGSAISSSSVAPGSSSGFSGGGGGGSGGGG